MYVSALSLTLSVSFLISWIHNVKSVWIDHRLTGYLGPILHAPQRPLGPLIVLLLRCHAMAVRACVMSSFHVLIFSPQSCHYIPVGQIHLRVEVAVAGFPRAEESRLQKNKNQREKLGCTEPDGSIRKKRVFTSFGGQFWTAASPRLLPKWWILIRRVSILLLFWFKGSGGTAFGRFR